eukprot:364716-Chlamydomonas_euryale.AAC.1
MLKGRGRGAARRANVPRRGGACSARGRAKAGRGEPALRVGVPRRHLRGRDSRRSRCWFSPARSRLSVLTCSFSPARSRLLVLACPFAPARSRLLALTHSFSPARSRLPVLTCSFSPRTASMRTAIRRVASLVPRPQCGCASSTSIGSSPSARRTSTRFTRQNDRLDSASSAAWRDAGSPDCTSDCSCASSGAHMSAALTASEPAARPASTCSPHSKKRG